MKFRNLIKAVPIIIMLTGFVLSQDIKGNIEYGKYKVGFNLTEKTDYSRSYGSEAGRDVRIYVWYPSEQNGEYLSYGDFVKYALEDFSTVENVDVSNINFAYELPLARGMNSDSWKKYVSQKTSSVKNSQVAKGIFPIIVFGQGLYYESPLTHLLMCEMLASHGYVVVTTPLKGTDSRLVRLNVYDVETEVRDMEFALSVMLKKEYIDKDRIGAMGFDLGGMSALLTCMRNRSIKLLVTPDAGIVVPHRTGLPRISDHYNLERFNIPWLHMTRLTDYYAFSDSLIKVSLFEQKQTGDSYLLLFNSSTHVNYTSYSMFSIENNVPGYWSSVSNIKRKTYETVCRYSLNFITAYLKNDSSALEFLNSTNEYEDDFEFHKKKGSKPVTMIDDFIDKINTVGIDKAIEFFKMNNMNEAEGIEDVINNIGYKYLYFWVNPDVAKKLFEYNVELHPKSSNAYDSLGESAYLSGKREEAVNYYNKSLEMNPKNENAKRMLEQLKN